MKHLYRVSIRTRDGVICNQTFLAATSHEAARDAAELFLPGWTLLPLRYASPFAKRAEAIDPAQEYGAVVWVYELFAQGELQ